LRRIAFLLGFAILGVGLILFVIWIRFCLELNWILVRISDNGFYKVLSEVRPSISINIVQDCLGRWGLEMFITQPIRILNEAGCVLGSTGFFASQLMMKGLLLVGQAMPSPAKAEPSQAKTLLI